MSASPAEAATSTVAPPPEHVGFRSDGVPDRVARRILGVTEVDPRSGAGAHRTFRIAVVISALRCLITYVAIPVIIFFLIVQNRQFVPVENGRSTERAASF